MTRAPFRDTAGALAAFGVVMAYVAVGFTVMILQVFFGATVSPQEAWMAGLSSLASAGLGYLIGRNDAPAPQDNSEPPPLPHVASSCNIPECAVCSGEKTNEPRG